MTDAAGVVTTARMIAATLAKKIQDADQVPMVARTRVAADLPVVVGAKKNLRPMSATKTAAVAVAVQAVGSEAAWSARLGEVRP